MSATAAPRGGTGASKRMTGSDRGPLTIRNDRGQATRRLIRLYESANDEELAYGLSWYSQANDWLRALAAETGVTLQQAAGIAAALSPRTNWPDNMAKTEQVLVLGDTYGLSNGRDKAKAILAGADPTEVLSGPKTRAFYTNLVDPLNSEEVTVDAHAFDAAAGQVTSDRQRKALGRVGEYERIADMYRSAARYLGVAPHVVQAVVWAVWRNRNARYHYQRINNREDTS